MINTFEWSSPHPTATSTLKKQTLQGGSRAECTIYRREFSAKHGLESPFRPTETAYPNMVSSTSTTRLNRNQPTAPRPSGLQTLFVEHQKCTPLSRIQRQCCSDKGNSIGANDFGKYFCCLPDDTNLQCDPGRKTLKFQGRLARTSAMNFRKRFNSLNKLLGLPGEPIIPAKHGQVVASSSTPVAQERCTDDILRRVREEAWTMATRQSMFIIARYRSQASHSP
jgi:hypothetical protein